VNDTNKNTDNIHVIDKNNPDLEILKRCAKILFNGGLVIFPTETVYGIGVNALKADSCKKLYKLKNRPTNKPFSYHFDSLDSFFKFSGKGIDKKQKLWFKKLIPNPVTLIYFDSNFNKKIGVRITEDLIAKNILKNASCPIFATSVNFSSEKSAIRILDVNKELINKVDMVIDAGETKNSKESTVIDISKNKPVILRHGAFKL